MPCIVCPMNMRYHIMFVIIPEKMYLKSSNVDKWWIALYPPSVGKIPKWYFGHELRNQTKQTQCETKVVGAHAWYSWKFIFLVLFNIE